jgi:hypothetical protein
LGRNKISTDNHPDDDKMGETRPAELLRSASNGQPQILQKSSLVMLQGKKALVCLAA